VWKKPNGAEFMTKKIKSMTAPCRPSDDCDDTARPAVKFKNTDGSDDTYTIETITVGQMTKRPTTGEVASNGLDKVAEWNVNTFDGGLVLRWNEEKENKEKGRNSDIGTRQITQVATTDSDAHDVQKAETFLREPGDGFARGKLGRDSAESKAEAKKRKDCWHAATFPKEKTEKVAVKRPAAATTGDIQPKKVAKQTGAQTTEMASKPAVPVVEPEQACPVTPVKGVRAKQRAGATFIPKAAAISEDSE
ncbi:unnamed protein product, partial [Prorocentrum cordatum]